MVSAHAQAEAIQKGSVFVNPFFNILLLSLSSFKFFLTLSSCVLGKAFELLL